MFKHYLTAAIRLIKRSILFSSINIVGFILGITAAFLIYLWIVDELTFEDFHKNRDSIYRVVEVSKDRGGRITETPVTTAALAKAFREEFASIKNATFIKYETKLSLKYNNNIVEGKFVWVDSCFFDVFSFPIVEGNPQLIGTDPNNIVISRKFAQKLFGDTPATGKQVSYEIFGDKHLRTVVGVVDIPRKSHIQFEIVQNPDLFPRIYSWNFQESTHVYIQMGTQSISGVDRKGMSSILTKHTDTKSLLYFQPLTNIHLHTNFTDTLIGNHGNSSQIYLFAALAILIIFMGAFNFTTLSTAQASLRYKEIGVRKVTGAKQKTLITQFLSESTIQAFISLALALALTELMLPLFNWVVDKDISLSISWQVLLFVFGGILLIGCLAGSYPAFYLSTINPLLAFKGGQKTGKKGSFIKALVCVQFFIAIVLIVCTVVMFKQLKYMQNQDLGFEKENIISVNTNLWYNVDEYKQEILKNPNVISVAMGAHIVDYMKGYSWENNLMEWDTPSGGVDSLAMVQMWGDGDFIKTFGIELLKGELFTSDTKSYWSGSYNYPTLINETAWKRMKLEDPIGMPIRNPHHSWSKGVIVGIVKDFNFQPLRENIKPVLIRFSPESLLWLHIRIAPNNQQETIKFLEERYREMAPPFCKVFNYKYLTDSLIQSYAQEQQQSRVLLIFTVLSIIIAMMGVFGLVALSTQQRTKEIGVRKVIGARTNRIVKMFCKEYLRWIIISFAIACPVAYIIMYNWLNSFAYRTSLSWWIFPLAGIIIFIITMITVIGQTYHTASQNPVTSLRYE
ncbi:ABC transporter permease [Bacteroides sp. 519]|uniref:ABC transporter permease n=1 Tax=Bacteroides sp. 519 TaxID=2302937 RepID=UPI0013D5C699|nr:ABC transporter permease [Bacteroides sp. 519]NDV56606.1 ABC transporter permease [Bacteroides sp. 519]